MIGRRRLLAVMLAAACASPTPPTPAPATLEPTPSPTRAPTAAPTPRPTPAPTPAHAHDDSIDLAGLAHDSRDLRYRTPFGAVPAGTPVRLRLRTFWNDASQVRLRVFSVNAGAEQLVDMDAAAQGVACEEEPAAIGDRLCDFWEAQLENAAADNVWYRFIVVDGSATAYYADDSSALDGGPGHATSGQIDNSYALTVYEPGFEAPDWARSAVAYQIFPDRFRNGDPANDPRTGDPRYDDPVLALGWGELPEGYCRGYAGPSATCPWRFDDDPPSWSREREGPRGRDYFGGDLRGVIEQLDHLAELGIDTIYFNPIFAAGSNHRYDTRDYEQIDPYLGTQAEFDELIVETRRRGMRIILDGVFNHTSSDGPWFDRYRRFDGLGACEDPTSDYRDWYYMNTARGPCAGPGGPGTANYLSWFGFDTLPVLLKGQPELQDYFLHAPDSITRRWLEAGAEGWRMDVSNDPSFPRAYWPTFREVVRATSPEALTISETWQKDSALLRNIRGDRFDTTMNYRLRDAVLGLLAPQPFDAKGFADSGRPLSPSRFAARLMSVVEDYPPATLLSLMNLLDSHDTERILWTLTPGPETRAGRELDAGNLAEGKARLRLASLIQFSVPGMPTVYYGDEVGLTGDDDPDDRRTYPWADMGGEPDMELFAHYRELAALRRSQPALRSGEMSVLLADDAAGTVVLGRLADGQAAIVAINSSLEERTLAIPLDGLVPDGSQLELVFATNHAPTGPPALDAGELRLTLPPLGGVVLAADRVAQSVREAPGEPPANLQRRARSSGAGRRRRRLVDRAEEAPPCLERAAGGLLDRLRVGVGDERAKHRALGA